jgi:hypothetical protein
MADVVLNGQRTTTALRPHTILMTVLLLAALTVGYSLLPGERDRIAMLERDGQKKSALQALEKRFRAGDTSQQTIYQLQELYEQAGNLKAAQSMLEKLAELRPRDAQVQKRLATFYKSVHDDAGYIASLQSQITLRYSDQACKELVGLKRLDGDSKGEYEALTVCRQKGYRRTEDLVRLAYFQLASGETAAATSLLKGLDDVRRLRLNKDRSRLFDLLLEADQPREAVRRATRWLKAQRDEPFALQLIQQLTEDKRIDEATDLAREVSTPGDSVSLSVAELMLEKGQSLAARTYLRGWVDRADLKTDDILPRFLAAALDAEDPECAYIGARRVGLDKIAQVDLVPLAEALAASGRTEEFSAIRAHLNAETIGRNPLLGAAVELSQGAPQQTRRLLASVQPDQLDEWRLSLWARLMQQTGSTQQAAAALRDLGVAVPASVPDRPLATPKRIVRPLRDQIRRTDRSGRPSASAPQKPVPRKASPASAAKPPPAKSVFDTQSVFGKN